MKKLSILLIPLAIIPLLLGCSGATTPTSVPDIVTKTTTVTTTPSSLASTATAAPATFTISDLSISPLELNIGERLNISVLVTYNGNIAGNYKAIFKINNVTVETVDVPMTTSATSKVDFGSVCNYGPGTYSVDVNGLSGTFTVRAAPTPTTTSTLTTTTATPATTAPSSINTKEDLARYLTANYGTCKTSLGSTTFTFDIYENTSVSSPYDYWIKVGYNSTFFFDLQYSNTISNEMNSKVCQELKDHQEALAHAAAAVMPAKKMYGGYYDSWYRYPNIKVDLITRHYYSWVNYNPASIITAYNDAHITEFTWYPLIDDKLTR